MPSTDTRELDLYIVGEIGPALCNYRDAVEDGDTGGMLRAEDALVARIAGMLEDAESAALERAARRSPAERGTLEATREIVEKAFREALDLYDDAINDGSMFHPDACIEEPVERVMALFSPAERGEGELRCDKCDGRDIYTRYRRKGEYLDSGWPDYERARVECLRRYCRTCGCMWTDPLASPPAPVEGTREALIHQIDAATMVADQLGRVMVGVSLLRDVRNALAALPVQGERGLFPLLDDVEEGEDDDGSVRCTCEWADGEFGGVDPSWPSEIRTGCPVHWKAPDPPSAAFYMEFVERFVDAVEVRGFQALMPLVGEYRRRCREVASPAPSAPEVP